VSIQCAKVARWYSSHRPTNISRKFLGVAATANCPTSTSVHAKLTNSSGTGCIATSRRSRSIFAHGNDCKLTGPLCTANLTPTENCDAQQTAYTGTNCDEDSASRVMTSDMPTAVEPTHERHTGRRDGPTAGNVGPHIAAADMMGQYCDYLGIYNFIDFHY